jgi:hypothetical protein
MAAKIQKLEELLKEKDEKLNSQVESLANANNEVKTLKRIIKEEHLEHYKCIISENLMLNKENKAMKEYLLSYGIRWKGEKASEGEFRKDAATADLNGKEPMYRFKLKQGEIENELTL